MFFAAVALRAEQAQQRHRCPGEKGGKGSGPTTGKWPRPEPNSGWGQAEGQVEESQQKSAPYGLE